MKYIIPVKPNINESVNEYINKCSLWLLSFKRYLRKYINPNKLECRKRLLFQQPNIKWIINSPNYDIVSILNLYISKLQCFYDNFEGRCYYMVPHTIRCPYTASTLNNVIRTLEYGGGNMPPLYWIRPSFREFIESTVTTKNKHN